MDSAESKQASGSGISGKLVIIGILFVAFWAAGISWYFRYQATHRAVKFWGPEAATIIRDAPVVFIDRSGKLDYPTSVANDGDARRANIDVSHARGLTHFRNAL